MSSSCMKQWVTNSQTAERFWVRYYTKDALHLQQHLCPAWGLAAALLPRPFLGGQLWYDLYKKAIFPTLEPKKKKIKIFSHNPVIFPLIYPCGGVPASSRWSSGELGRKKSSFALKIVSMQLTHQISLPLCQTAGLPWASRGQIEGLRTIAKSPWWSLLSLYDFISVTVMFLRVKNNIHFPYLVVFGGCE